MQIQLFQKICLMVRKVPKYTQCRYQQRGQFSTSQKIFNVGPLGIVTILQYIPIFGILKVSTLNYNQISCNFKYSIQVKTTYIRNVLILRDLAIELVFTKSSLSHQSLLLISKKIFSILMAESRFYFNSKTKCVFIF